MGARTRLLGPACASSSAAVPTAIQEGSCFPLYGDAVVLGRERGDILFSKTAVSGTPPG